MLRLWTQLAGNWTYNDYTYTAVSQNSKATLSAPTGTTLSSEAVTFYWNASTGATAWWLDVGTTQGQGNIFGANTALATSQTVTGLPTTGGTVYVRLWTQSGGVWIYNDYTFTAANQSVKAAMISPVAGSTLPGASVTFSPGTPGWAATTLLARRGHGPRAGNIFSANVALATSQTVNGIPGARTIYVRLWTLLAGNWTPTTITPMQPPYCTPRRR